MKAAQLPPTRPCAARHAEPAAGCPWCKLYAAQADPRPVVRVVHCAARDCFDWSVTEGGRVVAAGSEPTEPEARAEADAATAPRPGPSAAGPLEWVPTSRLAADAVLLAAKLPADASAVVGIPRSGMIPAAVVASILHLPLWQLTEDGQLTRLGHGSRGQFGRSGGPLVVIDDTVYSGVAMRRAREHLRGRKAVYAAVYVRPERAAAVDVYARALACPHLLEWNVANSGPFAGDSPVAVYGAGLACDLDGVILHDAGSGGRPGTPYLVPRRRPCPLVVTGRPEASRAATEAQLRRWGVKWRELAMYPGDTIPADLMLVAAFKAERFAASKCGIFVESDPAQAAEVHRLSGKPVVCPVAGRVFA